METTSTLETSIREEARRAVEAVAERQAEEIKEMDKIYAEEIDRYRERVEDETRSRIDWERSRIASRGVLEIRKLRLRSLDELTEDCVEKALKRAGADPRYRRFLLGTIEKAVNDSEGSEFEIRLRKEDFSHKEAIGEAVSETGKEVNFTVTEDESVAPGGVLVENKLNGWIFNGTLERASFRKSPEIRREVMEVLKRHGFSN
ncbi:MAG: hypothetical protein AVO39_09920 [delta proteobacterium MLS_D]|jgi:vacuolar-type H+-ATPase subunit E/Vma4|nr:MAG: hypothetical protein AVO39_09920 [delta proteobacterium MLS_D]